MTPFNMHKMRPHAGAAKQRRPGVPPALHRRESTGAFAPDDRVLNCAIGGRRQGRPFISPQGDAAPRNNQKTRAVFGTFHKVYHKKSRLYTPNFTPSFDTGKFSRPFAENRIVPGPVLCYNQLIKLETYSYLHPVTERRNAL